MLGRFDVNPSQYKVIMTLAEGGSLGQRQLAQVIDVDPRNCVPIVDALVSRGLLARETDGSDRRRRVLCLTPKGLRLARDVVSISADIDVDLLRSLTSQEKVLLRRTLISVLDEAQTEAKGARGTPPPSGRQT